MNEEWEDDGYRCPKCGEMHECDTEDYDDDNEEMECNDCGYKFYGTAEHTTTFKARPDCGLNDEPHEYDAVENLRSGGRFFKCDKCEAIIFEQFDTEEFNKILEAKS